MFAGRIWHVFEQCNLPLGSSGSLDAGYEHLRVHSSCHCCSCSVSLLLQQLMESSQILV
jgi:hypothetical protein